MSKFTIAEALCIQNAQLVQWEPLLKAEIYGKLCALVAEKNRQLFESENPKANDVFRGQDIDRSVLTLN